MSEEIYQLEPLQVQNLRDRIEHQIRNAILSGDFKPGTRLVETSIAQQLGVSRAPVREALSALEPDGIVVSVPRRGYFVVDFTDTDIEEIYSLRLLLEVGALPRAITRVAEQELTHMQTLVKELDEAAHRMDAPDKIVALDLQFHEQICLAAGHSRLFSAWDRLRVQTQLLIGVTSRTHYKTPDQPGKWHRWILSAIEKQDLDLAQKTVREHIVDAQNRAHKALGKVHAERPENNRK